MADSKRYQVVSAAYLGPVSAADGSTVFNTLYRGMVFTADPDNYRVKHNLDSGYIIEVGDDDATGVDAAGTPLLGDKPSVGDGEAGDPARLNDPGVRNEAAHREARTAGQRRAADGEDGDNTDAARRGRPSADEKKALVEQAVKAGLDRGEAEKASVPELRAALKK